LRSARLTKDNNHPETGSNEHDGRAINRRDILLGTSTLVAAATLTTELTIPGKGAEGVLAAAGGSNGGWSLYVQDGKLTYHYNLADFEHNTVKAKDPSLTL
jgi:hypothetical protein